MPNSQNESFEVVEDGECRLEDNGISEIISQPSASLPTLSPTGVAQPNASQEPEPSLSQPTASEDHELHPKEKLLVLISGEGEAIGPKDAKFSSRA
ncbi:hypothetical protein FRX31_018366 [Thalictrum thalictroides]|uniref:Uncharacterized protein n=1 Tax=Thalictrum thalictroides TaxID=46969 RepID=A0A7J6W5G4_THATH|nr:hypothetical protein FRX31_018366 [Thalictrum thalictroides]